MTHKLDFKGTYYATFNISETAQDRDTVELLCDLSNRDISDDLE